MSSPSMPPAAGIVRADPPGLAAPKELLASFLDYHRATLELKCAGLSGAQLKQATCPPSTLTLLGLVRHLTDAERNWFQSVIGGAEFTPRFYRPEALDDDFDALDADPVETVWAAWHDAVARSREILAASPLTRQVERRGERLSVGWIATHMLEEYARHNGHADLIREAIDGARGE